MNFGMDDLWAEADNGRTMARGVAVGLGVLFLALSGLTTFLFFSEYATAVGKWAGPDAAPLVAGIIGVLCLDVGSMAWSYVRSRAATSGSQMTVALVAAGLDLVMSLLTSALFIALSTTLETGLRGADGSLTETGLWVNYLGVAVITLSLLVNFSAVFLWMNGGANTKAAEQQTALRAVMAAGRHEVDRERTRLVVENTIEAIKASLPAEAATLARRQRELYLDATMNRDREATGHSANGQHARPTNGR